MTRIAKIICGIYTYIVVVQEESGRFIYKSARQDVFENEIEFLGTYNTYAQALQRIANDDYMQQIDD